MTSDRQISRVFVVFLIFKGISQPGVHEIKFLSFSRMCGNPELDNT